MERKGHAFLWFGWDIQGHGEAETEFETLEQMLYILHTTQYYSIVKNRNCLFKKYI